MQLGMILKSEASAMVYDLIQELIVYGINNKLITEDDEYVVRNQLMDIFKLDDWEDSDVTNAPSRPA